jgi:hypothetical protein
VQLLNIINTLPLKKAFFDVGVGVEKLEAIFVPSILVLERLVYDYATTFTEDKVFSTHCIK